MFGNSIYLAEKSLDYLWLRQEMTLNNIANVDTPEYKGSYVTFEDELKKMVGSMPNKKAKEIREDISNTQIKVVKNEEESTRMDGNNVSLDVENVELARTQIQYQYMVRSITDDFTRLRTAIKGQ